QGLDAGDLVNVNIPALRPGWPRGIRMTRQSTSPLPERFEKREAPGGRPYYWLAGQLSDWTADEEDTDLPAPREGYIAVTPLRVNLTDRARLQHMRTWSWPALEPDHRGG